MTRTFRLVDPERTRALGPVHVELTLAEDGLPDVFLMYRNQIDRSDEHETHERNWAIVRFMTAYFVRLYDDEFRLEPEAPEEAVGPRDQCALMVARDSDLKDTFIAGNIHQPGVGLWPLGRNDRSPDPLHHYRLFLDHDGIFDILALGVEVTEELVQCPAHDPSRQCAPPPGRLQRSR
jgi:hypothetical protein